MNLVMRQCTHFRTSDLPRVNFVSETGISVNSDCQKCWTNAFQFYPKIA